MAKIYTKTGDKGQTSLVGGQRIDKFDLRIDLYGDVDELNSYIGVARAKLVNELSKKTEFDYLEKLQSLLFNIGSNIACVAEEREKFKLPTISKQHLTEIENQIDDISKNLDPLSEFILPGGSQLSADLNVCRTISRRVERKAISYNSNEGLPDFYLSFFNRLSDYFFVLGRFANKVQNIKDQKWDKNV